MRDARGTLETGSAPSVGSAGSEKSVHLRLPAGRRLSPLAAIGIRLGIALGLVLVSWALVLVERGGYRDSVDGTVSVVDALYYTTVTLSTTGYGDITPVTTAARLINALVVTPMRVLFVIVLVGTTIQALTQRSRAEFRRSRWRSRVHDHVVVLGYGTKGRGALRVLTSRHHPREQVVVIERDPVVAEQAVAQGWVVVTGDATRSATLRTALVERAATTVVALGRDDSAILATLAVRRLAPRAAVVAAVRESENALLLRQSGATSVVVSSETTGRLLGLATSSPDAVEVVEDLVSFGTGLDLTERTVRAAEVGRPPSSLDEPVIAISRDGRLRRYDDPVVALLAEGDRLLVVSTDGSGAAPTSRLDH